MITQSSFKFLGTIEGLPLHQQIGRVLTLQYTMFTYGQNTIDIKKEPTNLHYSLAFGDIFSSSLPCVLHEQQIRVFDKQSHVHGLFLQYNH